MSELQELRELKIANEKSEQFFIDLETLIAEHLNDGTPIESISFYLQASHLALMTEAVSQIYDYDEE